MPTLQLYFQILSHGLDPLEDLWGNSIKKGSIKIREDMGGRARGQNLFIPFLENAIVKNQFGHLRSLHRRLDDQRISKGGRKFELTGQLNNGCQEIPPLKLKGTEVETLSQVVSAGFEPANIVTMPDNAISIDFVESNLKRRLMISHLLPFLTGILLQRRPLRPDGSIESVWSAWPPVPPR